MPCISGGVIGVEVLGVLMALIAVVLATRPAADRHTLQRAEMLAAAANAVLVFGIGITILIKAVQRFREPPEVASSGMLVVALITGFQRADAFASALIGLAILPRAWVLLRAAVTVLLEAVPTGLDLAEIHRELAATPGVRDVHDLHAWSIRSGTPMLTAHVVARRDENLLDRLNATMTSFRRSGVPMRICPTCESTLLPAGGLDQILARERQAAGPPAYQDHPDQRGDYRGGQHGGWGDMFGGGPH